MITTKCKYFHPKKKIWQEIEVKIDKKLNYDYSKCSWFAIDGEFTGLYPQRDKSVMWTLASEDENGGLRVEMLYTFDGDADFSVLKELIGSEKEKILWVGLADLAFLYKDTGIMMSQPLYDIRYASTITRTYTGEQSLDLLIMSLLKFPEDVTQKRLMGQSKEFALPPESWSETLHQYNVNDVIYLKALADEMKKLDARMGREELVQAANEVLPKSALLYANGFYRSIFTYGYKDVDMASGTIIPQR